MKPLKINVSSLRNKEQIQLLAKELQIEVDSKGVDIQFNLTDESVISIQTVTPNHIEIRSKDESDIYLALFLIQLQYQKNPVIEMNIEKSFKDTGVFLDSSRNGVVTVSSIKSMIRKVACLGYSQMYLYMEDVYEVPEQPYFGALRGRYKQSDLRELAEYADQFGIELIPAIQTLAHMKQFLEWDHIEGMYGDLEDILNVGRPATLELIDQMLSSLRHCFISNRIHLGMDEAYHLGRGSYLDEYGLKSKSQVMTEYLEILLDKCQQHQFKPLLWDDMFFRESAPFKGRIDERLKLVCWDYYSIDKDHYKEKIATRKQLTDQVVFAGGAWRWVGYSPHHLKTLYSSIAALQACKEVGIPEVMLTIWGDDGNESPVYTSMFGIVLYAYLNLYDTYQESEFSSWLQFVTGLNYDEWTLQGEFDMLPHLDIKEFIDVNPSKYFFYQDLFLPLFMKYIPQLGLDYGEQMNKLINKFEAYPESHTDIKELYISFAKVLKIKWDLPYRIYQAYHQGDHASLKRIAENLLPQLQNALRDFQEKRTVIWLKEAHPSGLEVLHYRISGMVGRIDYVKEILLAFCEGRLSTIPELEENRQAAYQHDSDIEAPALLYTRALRNMSPNQMYL